MCVLVTVTTHLCPCPVGITALVGTGTVMAMVVTAEEETDCAS